MAPEEAPHRSEWPGSGQARVGDTQRAGYLRMKAVTVARMSTPRPENLKFGWTNNNRWVGD